MGKEGIVISGKMMTLTKYEANDRMITTRVMKMMMENAPMMTTVTQTTRSLT